MLRSSTPTVKNGRYGKKDVSVSSAQSFRRLVWRSPGDWIAFIAVCTDLSEGVVRCLLLA